MIESIEKVDVTRVRSAATRGHMLTEDENIVEINLAVQYVVKDPKAFVLDIRNAERTLDYATDAALRHEVGSSELHQVLTEGRSVLAVRTQERLQKSMDFYSSGLQISKVNIESTQAPAEVQDAFQDVQRAKEDEQRVKAEAEAYKNKVVPEARGMSQRILEEASAYKEQVISRAKGESSRFLKLLSVYEKSPAVTRERLYLDTMERVMTNSSKVLVDVEGGNNMMYLPLDKMMSNSPSTSTGSPLSSGSMGKGRLSGDEIGSLTDRVLQELRTRQSETTSRRGRE